MMTEMLELEKWMEHLREEERSQATIRQYERDVRRFLKFAGERKLSKEIVIAYKEELISRFKPSSVNTKLAAVNGYLGFAGLGGLRVRRLKVQRSAYCERDRELEKAEYQRMIRQSVREGDARLELLIKTICSTGIRVSELRFITAEAAKRGSATVSMKGKTRTVFLPSKLCSRLKKYAARMKISSGPLFITRTGRPLDRTYVWRLIKALGARAGVKQSKVFPHNLRHLFARSFYDQTGDVVKLADVLGHSSIDTTRIYTVSSGREHLRMVEALGLL